VEQSQDKVDKVIHGVSLVCNRLMSPIPGAGLIVDIFSRCASQANSIHKTRTMSRMSDFASDPVEFALLAEKIACLVALQKENQLMNLPPHEPTRWKKWVDQIKSLQTAHLDTPLEKEAGIDSSSLIEGIMKGELTSQNIPECIEYVTDSPYQPMN